MTDPPPAPHTMPPNPSRWPIPHTLRVAVQFFVSHGPLHGLHVLAIRFRRRHTPHLTSPLDLFPRQIPPSIHPFDLKYNVDTSGFQHGEDLGSHPQSAATAGISSPHSSTAPLLPSTLWNTAYYGIAPSLFDHALALIPSATSSGTAISHPVPDSSQPPDWRHLPDPPKTPDWSTFTFVDLGCGKGRALLLASRYSFQQILGVELDAALAATAQANLRTFHAPWQQCHTLAALHADATTVDLPLTPLVLYLYHPFLAPALKQVLRRLERSLRQHPRELWLVYINPEAAHVLRAFPFLRYVTHTILTLDPEDAIPDRLGSSQEEVALYHVLPPADASQPTPPER